MTWKLRPEVLLSPNIPKPMHGLAPRVILGTPWWDKTRKAAYASTNQRCIACGVHRNNAASRQWLEGHELYDTNYEQGRLTYIETVPLCHYCHNYIHDGRLWYLLQKGEVHQYKYAAIIQHGDKVLAEAGLRSKESHEERERRFAILDREGKIAPWSAWRLVLFGKEYPPLHATYADWVTHHA